MAASRLGWVRRGWRQHLHGRVALCSGRGLGGVQSHGGRTSTAREVSLVMRAHWVLHGTIGIVGVRHGDVAVVIAQLRGGHGRGCATLRHVSVLIVSERTRRLLVLAILLGIIPLAGAVVSSLRAGSSVRVALPLIHGRGGRWTMGEGGWVVRGCVLGTQVGGCGWALE